MVKIKAHDDLGAGFYIYEDPFGSAAPLFDPPLTTYQVSVNDWDDDTTLYRFWFEGHPDIVAASVITRETATSVEILQVTYENALGQPLIVYRDVGVTYSTEGLPPGVTLDLSAVAAEFVSEGRVSLKGDDEIQGAGFDDVLHGLEGDDRIWGLGGNDMLFGEAGDDWFQGGAGADTMDGGDGTDIVSYTASILAITVDLANNGSNAGDAAGDVLVDIETIAATGFDDFVSGTIEDNIFYGGNGNDTLYGKGGNDLIKGGAGDDTITGDVGADILVGEAGNDWLDGGTGADTIRAGDGDDWIIGDANDLVIQGGAGYDTVDFSGSGAGVYLSQNDTKLSGLEHVIGTDMDDTIQYTSSVEDLTLEGGDGNDNLNSGSGNDTLIGGDGNDYLHGGYGGNDLLYGEAGNDIIYANDGDDMIWGGIGDDDIIVNDGNDIGYGGDGDDTLYCWDWNIGDAELYGEAGNDRIYIWGGSLYASGGDGDDVLEMEGLDSEERYSIMNGDAGNDTFRVYYGNGYLSGGEGTDEFFFHEYGYSADVVLTDWDNEALYFSEYFLYDYPDPVPVDPGPEDIMAFASVVGDDIVFNFTGDYSDNTVTLQGVTDLDLVESWVSLF